MFRSGILPRILLALLIVALLSAGGVWLYRVGWAQGYQTAAISAASAPAGGQGLENDPGRVAPYAYGPWGYRPYMWGPGFGFFPFFPLIGCGFFLLFLFLMGGLFRGWGYRRWGGGPGPGPGHWHPERVHAEQEKKAGEAEQ